MMRDSEPKLPIHCSRPPTTNTTALGTGMGKKTVTCLRAVLEVGDAIILLILDIYFIRRRLYNLLSASY